MDVRIVTIVAGLVAALVGVVFLAPDLFVFAGLPESFGALGTERVITGLALLLLGFIGVLSELDPQPKRRRRVPPGPVFSFDEQPALAGPASDFNPLEQPLDRPFSPSIAAPSPVPERDATEDTAPVPASVAPEAPRIHLVSEQPEIFEPPVRLVHPQPDPELPLGPPLDPRRDPPAP